jgi:uncharacterized protein
VFKLIPLAAAAIALTTLAPAAEAASFNCYGALNRTEAAICASPRLSALDDQMAAVHGRLLSASNASQRRFVAGGQVDWLRKRNACGAGAGCIAGWYDTRIFVLHRFLGD